MGQGGRVYAVILLGIAIVMGAVGGASASIELFIDGQAVATRPALKLIGSGLGVPASVLEDEFGAEVDDSDFPLIALRHGGGQAVLLVDDAKALIDGVQTELGTPAVVVDEVLFLPLTLVAELFRLRIDWNAGTGVLSLQSRDFSGRLATNSRSGSAERTVEPVTERSAPRQIDAVERQSGTNLADRLGALGIDRSGRPVIVNDVQLAVVDDHVQISVRTDRAVSADVMFLPEPDRLVIDLDNAVLATETELFAGDGSIVKRVRGGVTSEGTIRFVADLTGPTGYALLPREDGRGFTIQLNHQLHLMHASELADGGVALHMYASGPLHYRTFRLREPERLVIDVFGASVSGAQELGLPSRYATSFRMSQFDQNIVRGVFVLDPDTTDHLTLPAEGRFDPAGNGLVQLWLNGDGVSAFTPPAYGHAVGGLNFVGFVQEDDSEFILIDAAKPLDVDVLRLTDPERVVLDLKGVEVERSLGLVRGSEGVVKAVRAGQAAEAAGRVVAETNGVVEHHLLLSPDRKRAVLGLRFSGLGGRTVVVDAGHGGRDPGAIGHSGTYEKDVTLAIALQVARLLRDAGANVVLTRDDDVELSLPERAELANELGADAFVSIHADAVGFGRVATGTSTFYHPENGNGPLTSINRRYAQSLQNSMLQSIGLRDRGVHEREFHVVLNTRMPSALVEVGFIDNPAEEQKLIDPAFQAKAATGIVNGIVRFFEEQAVATTPDTEEWRELTERQMASWLEDSRLPAVVHALEPTSLLATTGMSFNTIGETAAPKPGFAPTLLQSLQDRFVQNVEF